MNVEITSLKAYELGTLMVDRINSIRNKSRAGLIDKLTTRSYLLGFIKPRSMKQAVLIADGVDSSGCWQDWRYISQGDLQIGKRLVGASKLADYVSLSHKDIESVTRYTKELV